MILCDTSVIIEALKKNPIVILGDRENRSGADSRQRRYGNGTLVRRLEQG